jgi:hypothetical protein
MEPNWEDDWENTDLSELCIEVSIKNKERELKMLEERKLMEESEIALAKDLFNDDNECIELFIPVKPDKITIINDKKDKYKKTKELQEQKRKELKEIQKIKKEQLKRHKEIFGEAELDEYGEKYGYIEDNY